MSLRICKEGGAAVNQVTIPAWEFIQLVNRIRRLENTLVRIALLAEPDGFETEELNAIRVLAVEATTEDSLADHFRDATKKEEVQP